MITENTRGEYRIHEHRSTERLQDHEAFTATQSISMSAQSIYILTERLYEHRDYSWAELRFPSLRFMSTRSQSIHCYTIESHSSAEQPFQTFRTRWHYDLYWLDITLLGVHCVLVCWPTWMNLEWYYIFILMISYTYSSIHTNSLAT